MQRDARKIKGATEVAKHHDTAAPNVGRLTALIDPLNFDQSIKREICVYGRRLAPSNFKRLFPTWNINFSQNSLFP